MTDDNTTDKTPDELEQDRFSLDPPYVSQNEHGITEVSLEQSSTDDDVNIYHDPFRKTQRGTQRPDQDPSTSTANSEDQEKNQSQDDELQELDWTEDTASNAIDASKTEKANSIDNATTADPTETERNENDVEAPNNISTSDARNTETQLNTNYNDNETKATDTHQSNDSNVEKEKNIVTARYTPTSEDKNAIANTPSDTDSPSYKRVAANAGRNVTGASISVINIIGWVSMRIFEIFTALLVFCSTALIALYVVTALIPGVGNKPFLLWGATQLGIVALISAGLSVIGSRVAGKPDRYGSSQQSLEYS